MATNSITSGGMGTTLTHQATESVTRQSTDQASSQTTTPPDLVGDPNIAKSLPKADKPVEKELQAPSESELRELVDEMQSALAKASKEPLNVAFRPDSRAGGFVIEIRTGNGDVIKQFPPEKVLNMRSKLDELSGMVIDEMT